MSFLPLDKLLEKVDSRYKLILVAAKRARELSDGAPPLIEADENSKPTTIALKELLNDRLEYKTEKE